MAQTQTQAPAQSTKARKECNPQALDLQRPGKTKPDHFDPHLRHFQEAF